MMTFYSHSFGCRVNQAEKEELDRQLVQLGYTFHYADPALYIINTCSVTHKAEREARQLIYQTRRKYPKAKIVVTGCAATNWIKTKTEVPEVDLLVDNQNKEYLATIISKRFSRNSVRTGRDLSLSIDKYLRSKRLILKTQDGCQRYCTYCIVPYLRGLPKSVPGPQIVKRAQLYEDHINELILSSINTEAYGYDTREKFVDLLKEVLDNTKIPRLSFGSIHPWSVNQEFFDLYAKYPGNERIVNFFHIPLQSGSNKMLQLMKRGYTREEFVEKLATLGSLKPYIFIATDVIVGFLEETNKDFIDTFEFLKNSPVVKFHVFRFSKRQHTAAYYLSKRLTEPPSEEKQKRAQALLDLSKKKYTAFLRRHIGETFPALVLEKEYEGMREALLTNQIPVIVKAASVSAGDIKTVRILEYKKGRLFGRIV